MRLPQAAFEQPVLLGSSKATYSACIADFVPVATATDICALIGSAAKKVTITCVRITGAASANTYLGFYLYKRSTLNTGGTPTATPICKYDSLDPVASALVNQYAANPTTGTGVLLASDHLTMVGTASTILPEVGILWEYANRSAKAPVLNGATESLCINCNGATIPAGINVHLFIEWTEEG